MLAGVSAFGTQGRRAATRALFAAIGPDQPGCSVAVARNGRLVFAEAYGLASVEDGMPNTPQTLMDIASTSKQFTATAILLLAEDGELSLDDDVRRYLPELPDYGRPVTLRQMMHHQSGIPDYIDLLADRIAERTTAADALTALRDEPTLLFAPGERYAYSNSNYFLFSLVVERVAGSPLPGFLQARVFGPAGVVAVMDPVGPLPGKARAYAFDAGQWVPVGSRWEQVGDGAVQTTPTELVRWASQYWNPTVGGDAVARARFDGVADTGPGQWYGAGIGKVALPDGAEMLTHDGGWAGFTTVFATIPAERLAVAASCNGVGASGPIIGVDAAELLAIWRSG